MQHCQSESSCVFETLPYSGEAAASSKPFWENWGQAMNDQSKKLGDGAGAWWKNVTVNSKNWKAPKWEMPGKPND